MNTRTRAAILLTAICCAALAACGKVPTVASSGSSSQPAETITPATETPSPTDTATTPTSFKLTDTVTYEGGVEVGLSGFTRGKSSEWAAPAKTPYIKFTVKVVNGSKATMDLSALSVSCTYGENAAAGDEIFDDGLDGSPTTHLLAGRTAKLRLACALPKSESYTQIEVTPDYDSEAAIFVGNVK